MWSTVWDILVVVGISAFLWSVSDSLKRIADAMNEEHEAGPSAAE